MKILQGQLKQAEFVRTEWRATTEPEIKLEDVLKPEFWTHVAKTLKVGDRIDVVSATGEWFAELFVRRVDATSATVFCLREVRFSEPNTQAAAGDPYEVRHRGGAGWSVIRKADKVVVFEKGQTRQDAEAWISDNTLA